MVNWKLNLVVLWLGNFLLMAGVTMIIPFLPLYLKTMGMENNHEVAVWGGLIFASSFLTGFLFQPVWGVLADRYGRKVMLLRSGFGMSVVMALMGFATAPWQLLILRLINGTISGFVPASVTLVSANTPKHKMGFAMGTLQSGSVAGTILGPLFGGLMADTVGYKPIFYITGILLFAASLLVLFLVREKFDKEKALSRPKDPFRETFRTLMGKRQLLILFISCFILQFALLSSLPVMALFVEELHGQTANLAFFAGLVGSINGFSNMAASPLLGRLSDRFGAHRVLVISLIGAGLAFFPQAMVTDVWQLLAARFLLGIFMGGLLPSIYALIRKYTPDGMESRSYSFNSSSISLGNFLGPVTGGAVSGVIGIRGIFILSGALLLLNAAWLLVAGVKKEPGTKTGSGTP